MEDREEFVGGVNRVVREGAVVRRPAGPWSATVQRLLAYLAAAGFDGAPRPHGLSVDGTEELVEFLPGEIGHDFAAAEVRSDASLVAAARLLRRMHDASAEFARTADDVWYFPAREPVEVICHGDAATYNTVFRDGVPAAFIDFDTAHPGPRLWDAAYTAYRFVPLYAPDEVELTLPPAEAFRRLSLFADAYVLTTEQRAALPGFAIEKLHDMVAYMHSEAAAGNAAFAGHIAEGHDRRYLADAEWIGRVYGGVLKTERLTLRPARAADLDWLCGHWTDPDVRAFLYDDEVLTSAQVGAELDASTRGFAASGYGLWLLEPAAAVDAGAGGDVGGAAGNRLITGPPAQPDRRPQPDQQLHLQPRPDRQPQPDLRAPLGTVGLRPLEDLGLEVYYSLAPEAWGRGYATEAARAVVDHALDTLGLAEVLAEVDAGNGASSAIIGKLGFEPFEVVPGVLGPMTRYRRAR